VWLINTDCLLNAGMPDKHCLLTTGVADKQWHAQSTLACPINTSMPDQHWHA
jgi:hypothetical protein